MIERLSFSRDENENIHFTMAGEDGEIIAHGSASQSDWDALRAKVIEQYPAEGGADVIDYIVALCELI